MLAEEERQGAHDLLVRDVDAFRAHAGFEEALLAEKRRHER